MGPALTRIDRWPLKRVRFGDPHSHRESVQVSPAGVTVRQSLAVWVITRFCRPASEQTHAVFIRRRLFSVGLPDANGRGDHTHLHISPGPLKHTSRRELPKKTNAASPSSYKIVSLAPLVKVVQLDHVMLRATGRGVDLHRLSTQTVCPPRRRRRRHRSHRSSLYLRSPPRRWRRCRSWPDSRSHRGR